VGSEQYAARKPKQAISQLSQAEAKISSQLVGEVDKTFETLYLRQDDMLKLKAVLHLFHNKRAHLKKLGLPYRLGIMLSGLPGTGKSSTIACIAHFLNRNIYYISLKEIQSDDELLRVVSFVNQQGNGVIVFEEIERNCPWLVCTAEYLRTLPKPATQDEVHGSKLTLECLLNVLQGSLSVSSSVFCATTNNLGSLEPALFRSGRFDLNIDMKLCGRWMVGQIDQSFMNRSLPEHLLHQVPEDVLTCSDVMFALSPLIYSDKSDAEIVQQILAIKS